MAMVIDANASSGLKSTVATASSALIGSATKTSFQTAITTSSFKRNPYPVGSFYELKAGTAKPDQLSAVGATAVFSGPGNDILTGTSRLSADRKSTIFPLLSGGPGNDRYNITKGNSVVIADMNGGNDTVSINGILVNNIRYMIVNESDLMITDGAMSVLLLDPLGKVSSVNKIETIFVNGVRKTMSDYYSEAEQSFSFTGPQTYNDIARIGLFNYQDIAFDSAGMTGYVKGPLALNNLMIG